MEWWRVLLLALLFAAAALPIVGVWYAGRRDEAPCWLRWVVV